MKKGIKWLSQSALMLSVGLLFCFCYKPIQAQTTVSDFYQLKQCLGDENISTIILKKDIQIKGMVTIRGEKIINGRGHCLLRSREKDKVYGGTLFSVMGKYCEWRNVTISGEADAKTIQGKIFGRLMEVRHGKVVLSERCLLKNNKNSCLAVDGGGALQVAAKGQCYMKAGSIEDNANVSFGGAVRIEKGGLFCMTGGVIANNSVSGIAAVNGFDGRGGAVYNAGTLRVEGGTIRHNTVTSYKDGETEYGGVGGAIYNEGKCLITGGAISDNKASLCGAAIYTLPRSALTIRGGKFTYNCDEEGRPVWVAGACRIGRQLTISHIYLANKTLLTVEDSLHVFSPICLEPSSYKIGRKLTQGKKTKFALKKKNYSLTYKKNGYYIAKNSSKEKSKKKSVKGEEEKFLLTKKKQKKTSTITIACPKKELVFYEGEYVDSSVLLYGVRVEGTTDRIDNKVEVIKPKNKLNTDCACTGKIRYRVTTKRGKKIERQIPYRVIKNKSPVIKSAARYFFVREVKNFTKKEWRNILWEGCTGKDDVESKRDMLDETTVEYSNLVQYKEGAYRFRLQTRDQYGHRYYMHAGEKRRYGKGKETTIWITVTVVDEEKEVDSIQYIQFVEPRNDSRCLVEWHFDKEDIRSIQTFMKSSKNPFSAETNQQFVCKYSYCRKRRRGQPNE